MVGALLEPHAEVRGRQVEAADVRAAGANEHVGWEELARRTFEPGRVEVRVRVDGGGAGAWVQLPPCAGRKAVTLDDRRVDAPPGQVVLPVPGGQHTVGLEIRVGKYERRIACGFAPVYGAVRPSYEGLGVLSFVSPYGPDGGGRAVVYVPPGHDMARPAALLVGLHPWNGTMWTYAAYAQLLAAAREHDLVLLMPSGLGNSLYTADAEDEAMRALDALAEVAAIDAARVSIWGASMGGAGATTVGFHHPDRFATITSFFGDSQYDLTTYVRGLLHDERGAHAVNALDVADNARWVPVRLVHGEQDTTSPIRQSTLLDDALRARGFVVHLARAAGMGHEGRLVVRDIASVAGEASVARAPASPPRVTYRSVRPWDTGAYGVHLRRASDAGDAFFDVELRDGVVHVRTADGVRQLRLDPGALGADAGAHPPIADDTGRKLDVRWNEVSP
jgi:predicted esterase